jgi:hypothetical protein
MPAGSIFQLASTKFTQALSIASPIFSGNSSQALDTGTICQVLVPYSDVPQPSEGIASLKITEAITISSVIDRDIDNVLANFKDPHNLDLAAFMENNLVFSMPLKKFSYLTGRPLTTFKRDFCKAYNTTPQRWLT